MKKLIAVVLLLLYMPAAFATAIVIIVTPHYILLGTDSKRQVLNDGIQQAAAQTITKIQKEGAYCFAMAGLTSSSGTGFTAETIIKEQLAKGGDYDKIINTIVARLSRALTKELQAMQLTQQPAFTRLAQRSDPLLEVVILSMQQGYPQMEIIGFKQRIRQKVRVESYTARCPGDCLDQQQQVYFMGSYNAMEQHLMRQKEVRDPAQLVETLILEQAKASPGAVGGPVRLIRFDASGMRWIK